jgi:hypothetical protein
VILNEGERFLLRVQMPIYNLTSLDTPRLLFSSGITDWVKTRREENGGDEEVEPQVQCYNWEAGIYSGILKQSRVNMIKIIY